MPGQYLTKTHRIFILKKSKKGQTHESIAEDFQRIFGKKISRSTVSRTIQRYQERGSVADAKKCGAPSRYNAREKREIIITSLCNPEKSIRDLTKDQGVNPKKASKSTLNNLLLAVDIFSRVLSPLYKGMKKRHIQKRKVFAQNYKNWTKDDWDLVVFTDEADLFPTKCGKKYYRTRGKGGGPDPMKYCQENQLNITIKVWGAISYYGVGPLVRYTGTMNQDTYLKILKNHLIKEYPQLDGAAFVNQEGLPPFIFMDDNAKPHTGNAVKKWKEENGVISLDWPPHSPDLNIIENIWSYLQDRLYDLRQSLHSPDDTWRESQKIWTNLNVTFIEKLYQSLPQRIEKIIKSKGGPI